MKLTKAKNKNKLTQKQKDDILAYGEQITYLPNFVDKVRQTVDVYIGEFKNNKGYLTCIREVFQNATDEMQKEESPCDHVIITFDERTKWVIVEENGRGFPHGQIQSIITEDHTSSNYKKPLFKYTAGKNGMGIGIVNALSSEFSVESSILGETHRVKFIEGISWEKGEIKIKSDKYQGSVVSFRPCIDVLGDVTATWQEVFYLVSSIVPTLKIGATVYFNAIDINGIEHHEVLVNTDGIMTHLVNMCENPMITPIRVFEDTGEMRIDALIVYDINFSEGERIRSFNNFCPTSSGTHENGLIDGVCNFFRTYINKYYLNNKKIQVTNADVLCGLTSVIHTCLLKPSYGGQDKDILKNTEIKPFCVMVISNALNEWSKKNPKDLMKICKWIKEIAEVRIKNDTAKVKITNNYKKSVISGNLPANYDKPIGKNDGHWELIIVEGKSAAGGAKNAADRFHQGIFGIRGKFPNAMSKTEASIMDNAEACALTAIMDNGKGTNIGPKYNIDLCPYEKIIIMTDADADGKGHIRPLLLKFFLVYMRPVVEAGRLYAAEPPLYSATIKKKTIYFSDDIELSKYVNEEFCKSNNISTLDGHKLTKEQITSLIMRNDKYTAMIDHVAGSFAINKYLLEFILNYYKDGFKVLKSKIEKRWRFMSVEKVNNTILVSGTIDKSYTIPVDERLLNACSELIKLVLKSDIGYIVNGNPLSLYDAVKVFESFRPDNIKRYKGLGEMDPEELKVSTIHPSYDRTLIRYTVEDIKKEISEIRKIESDFSVLLKGIRVNKDDLE